MSEPPLSSKIQLYRCQCGGAPRTQLMGTLVCDRCGNYREDHGQPWPPEERPSNPLLEEYTLVRGLKAEIERLTVLATVNSQWKEQVDAEVESLRAERDRLWAALDGISTDEFTADFVEGGEAWGNDYWRVVNIARQALAGAAVETPVMIERLTIERDNAVSQAQFAQSERERLTAELAAERKAFMERDEALARKLGTATGFINYFINADPVADVLIAERDRLRAALDDAVVTIVGAEKSWPRSESLLGRLQQALAGAAVETTEERK